MSSPTVTVRGATMTDLDTIVTFNHAMAEETEGKRLDRPTLSAGVQRVLEDPHRGQYFVAEIDGQVTGQALITYEWSDWRNGFFWWIQSVYVEPGFRRRGVFRALHDHIRGLIRSRADVRGLRLYVNRGNARAINTYHKLGMPLSDYLICEETPGRFQEHESGSEN